MFLRWFGFFAVLALCANAWADAPECGGVDLAVDTSIKPDWTRHADDLVNSNGLLWSIEKPGLAPSYLYGTMHSTSAGPMQLAAKAAPYATRAKLVATELGPLDAAQKIELGAALLRAAMSPEADTFSGYIEGEDAGRVEQLLAAKGTPALMAHHLKLWMLVISASLPKCEIEGQTKGLPEVDESFARIAEAQHATVVGLETIDEQLRTIASIPTPLAATILKSSARGGPLADDGYKTLLSLYEQKRPAAALAILDAAPGLTDEERLAEAEFTRRLLADRNATMADRAAPLLEKGGTFIAVGALHLSGKGGLIELLRRRGYQVTNVW
jgi:uncharacterized protein YbaP (TraB family)